MVLRKLINRRCILTTLHVCTQGISKNLVSRAFPETERPDYLTSDEFLKFTPTDDFMSLPGEILRTEFRLVVTHDGWEYTVLERELGAHRDPLRKMLVTVSPLLPSGAFRTQLSALGYYCFSKSCSRVFSSCMSAFPAHSRRIRND